MRRTLEPMNSFIVFHAKRSGPPFANIFEDMRSSSKNIFAIDLPLKVLALLCNENLMELNGVIVVHEIADCLLDQELLDRSASHFVMSVLNQTSPGKITVGGHLSATG